ncbi:hypothetical protein AALP_AA8G400300 [Arabis alpina]|nr:hypothetical protein AALP_AA8G400300 [Arabis alpina]
MAQGLDLICMVIFFLFLIHPSSQQVTGFVFNGFRQGDLHVDGVAQILPGGLLQLTNTSEQKMGHAFFKQPFEFNLSGSLTFSTHFVCAMVRQRGVTGGNGIAFFLSPTMDLSNADATQYFGLFNTTTNRSPSSHIFAIELDTVQSAEFDDIDNNHVGIDVNSLTSIESAPASYFSDKEGLNKSITLLSGDSIQVWIDYDGAVLNVSLAPLGIQKPSRSLLSRSINLSEVIQDRMFVGFSAATGQLANNHYILGWSFSRSKALLQNLDISKLPQVPRPPKPSKKPPLLLILLLVLLGIILLALLGGAYLYRRNKYAEVREEWEKEYGPHRYSYKSMYKATKGFHKDGFLGKGGFGEVYKGTLPQDIDIAVKRFSHDGERGMKQFVAEIASMGRLDHRNLVPLLGYCRRKGEFLLVSKYMPNGSLDQFLFHNKEPSLPWSKRLPILKGIASALHYLHTGATQVVLHRDVKASNVMLDTNFIAKLGDFGMARLHDHGANPNTTGAVGTVGYMAPELTSMGASTKTDVYAFGAFILEVACGRRPVEPTMEIEKQFLVEWVCDCWRKRSLLDARDPKLSGEGESSSSLESMEMVMKLGLICTNFLPESRPEMEEVVRYLNGRRLLPDFSPESPGIGILSPVMVGGSSSVMASSPANETMSSPSGYTLVMLGAEVKGKVRKFCYGEASRSRSQLKHPGLCGNLRLAEQPDIKMFKSTQCAACKVREDLHIRSRLSDSSSAMARWLLQILIISSLHLFSLSNQQETRFVYDNFTNQENLYLDKSARILPSGLLQLTSASEHQMGHTFYNKPIDFSSSGSLSFSTHFVCALVPKPGVEGGHGIAFVISPSMDFSHAESTRYLGVFNVSSSEASSTRVLAVELDTIWNPDFKDINNNHVGIDVNSPLSVAIASASYYSDMKGSNESINLLSGKPIQVWVDYEGTMLNVTIAPLEVQKPSRPLLSHPINISENFPNISRLFVGFSAATGTAISDQYILWWSFSTNRGSLQRLDISKLPEVPHPKAPHKKLSPLVIILPVGLAVGVLGVLAGLYFRRRKKYSEVSETWEKEFDAHRFSYRTLYKATKGFSKDEFLGKGGFGEVYRGNLPQGREIAVKRVSHNGDEGVKQFVAEVVSMRCLKHRNLVPLFGYCRRKRELLLVSEYMPNGSLDEHLFDDQKPVLSWPQRLVAVKGIASALCYLHTGADQVVLHRDVKASNIMLDAEFNGRLGDFGMARFHDHGANAATTAAVGTIGYMAPELITMGASTGTDVYAFGVFMLEVTCGRRPVEPQLQVEKRHMIKWVCECWKKDSLLDATDPRLEGEYIPEEVEMVMKLGLLCSNIVPESRPTMEQVVLYLNKNLPLPDFSPYTLGIGTFAPVLVDASSLVVSSASWNWSAPSMSSSSNHSPYAYQAPDQPWGQTIDTTNSLHLVAESEKPPKIVSTPVKTATLPAEDLESNLSSLSSQR